MCLGKGFYQSTIDRNQGEGQAKYGARVLAERYRLYAEHFKCHQNFSTTQEEFKRVVKIINGKFGNWRNKKEELYLNPFSPSNWDEERVITKDGNKSARAVRAGWRGHLLLPLMPMFFAFLNHLWSAS